MELKQDQMIEINKGGCGYQFTTTEIIENASDMSFLIETFVLLLNQKEAEKYDFDFTLEDSLYFLIQIASKKLNKDLFQVLLRGLKDRIDTSDKAIDKALKLVSSI